MDFRSFVSKLDEDAQLLHISKPVDLNLELGGVIKAAGEKPLLFENVNSPSKWKVAANIFPNRDLVAKYLGVKREEIVHKLMNAIDNPSIPKLIPPESAPVLKNSSEPNLYDLPIPKFTEKDGGPYIASAIVIAYDPEYGFNSSFHRMMVVGKDRLVARILPRHLNEYHKRSSGELPIAIVLGSPINVLLASATSVDIGVDELQIANTLMPYELTTLPNGLVVPANAEVVLEGVLTNERVPEGPFVDLTETYDVVREERVIKINKIYYRDNPLFHVLLPGGPEHKVLMGMPREPTIFREVNRVSKCVGVNITPGGCSWLHAVVGISKNSDDEVREVIEAAFRGHKSLKHVIVVDDDIDIYNPNEVEWAIATRFQADRDLVIKKNEKGSSLDPSADPITRNTTKVGLDATAPIDKRDHFKRAEFLKVNLEDYLK